MSLHDIDPDAFDTGEPSPISLRRKECPTQRALCTEACREDPRWTDPVWVYRYFNADNDLLYIGMTFSIENRDAAHYKRTYWRHFATRLEAELFPSRRLASIAEIKAIHEEEPLENCLPRQPFPYEGVRDAWFITQQGGLYGCRKTVLAIDDRKLTLISQDGA